MNSEFIYNVLNSQTNNKHYLKRYLNFIEYANKSNKTYKYTERHHICPSSMFPEFSNIRKHKWNYIDLSPRHHFIAHCILAKAYGDKMIYAYNLMVHIKRPDRDYKINSRIYESLKMEFKNQQKIKFSGDKNPMFGRLGNKCPSYGLKRSQKTKKLQSESRRKVMRNVECPKCLKVGDYSGMVRWHFDNCGTTNSNTGSLNGMSKNVKIYNSENKLMYICNGNFKTVCEDNNLPYKSLSKSYKRGGTPILQDAPAAGKFIKQGKGFLIGWYAICEDY